LWLSRMAAPAIRRSSRTAPGSRDSSSSIRPHSSQDQVIRRAPVDATIRTRRSLGSRMPTAISRVWMGISRVWSAMLGSSCGSGRDAALGLGVPSATVDQGLAILGLREPKGVEGVGDRDRQAQLLSGLQPDLIVGGLLVWGQPKADLGG